MKEPKNYNFDVIKELYGKDKRVTAEDLQTSFFDQAAPHNKTDTSVDAAIDIQPYLNRLEQVVLDAVTNSVNGLTRDEISKVANMKTATVCARCNSLLKKKKLKPKYDQEGRKVTRPTESGRKAEVLFLVDVVAF